MSGEDNQGKGAKAPSPTVDINQLSDEDYDAWNDSIWVDEGDLYYAAEAKIWQGCLGLHVHKTPSRTNFSFLSTSQARRLHTMLGNYLDKKPLDAEEE